MSIDWTKPILWDGKPARVLATDMKELWPIAIRTDEGKVRWCYADGTEGVGRCEKQRVTNAPERVERWANVYGTRPGCEISSWCNTRDFADSVAGSDRTALVRYTFEGDKLVDVAIVPLEPAS